MIVQTLFLNQCERGGDATFSEQLRAQLSHYGHFTRLFVTLCFADMDYLSVTPRLFIAGLSACFLTHRSLLPSVAPRCARRVTRADV